MSELQEQEDWTVDTTVLARNILVYLGIGNKESLEPGVDYRRDKICGMIESEIDRRIAAVREECAKIADSHASLDDASYDAASEQIAAAIRSQT